MAKAPAACFGNRWRSTGFDAGVSPCRFPGSANWTSDLFFMFRAPQELDLGTLALMPDATHECGSAGGNLGVSARRLTLASDVSWETPKRETSSFLSAPGLSHRQNPPFLTKSTGIANNAGNKRP